MNRAVAPPRALDFPAWVHVVAWGGVLALVLVLIQICHAYDGHNIWDGWTEAQEFWHQDYSERMYPADFFRTRANTWSNLIYVLVGFYALALGVHDSRRKKFGDESYLKHTPAFSFLFGTACVGLGFGSGFFHASLTRWGQHLDVAAMYSPLVVLVALNLGRWNPRVNSSAGKSFSTWPLLAGLALATCLLLFYFKWSINTGLTLLTLILSVTGFALMDLFKPRRRRLIRWAVLASVTVVAARVCWQLDVARKFSGPDTWFQGHAVWHLLTGLSLAGIYFFYRSESAIDQRGIAK